MKKSSIKISLLTILLVLSTMVVLQNSMIVQAVPNFYVTNPQTGTSDFIFYTNTTSVGYKFNATVWVTGWGTPPAFAWQVTLGYNRSAGGINITRAWLPAPTDTSYIFSGHTSTRPLPFIQNGPTYYVKVGDVLLEAAGVAPPPEPAKLATIEFQIIAAPTSGNLTTPLSFLNINVDTYLLDLDLLTIPTTATDGNYELNFVLPSTQISISANPATVNYNGRVTISGIIATVPPNASLTFRSVQVSIVHRAGTSSAFNLINTATTNSTSGYSYSWLANNIVPGIHQFQASWSGNASYSGATSSIASVTVVIPPGSPTMYLTNPQTGTSNFIFYTSNVAVGYRFNVTANVNNGTGVAGWQVTINYNATVLNATRAWLPLATDPQYIFYNMPTQRLPPAFNPSSVVVGDTTLPLVGVNFATPKKMATIEFEVMLAPPAGTGNKVSSTLDISSQFTYLLDTNPAEIPTFKTNGLYELRSGSKPSSQISVGASPATVIGGATVIISGTIGTASPPSPSATFPSARVTIWHRIGSGAFTNLTTVTTNSTSQYSYSWQSAGAGTHQFKANWTGNDDYTSAESTAVSVTVNKGTSQITLNANVTSVKVDSTVRLSGAITPARSNVNVTIASGTTTLGTVKTATDGTYSFAWTPSTEGTYSIVASWLGDDTFNGDSSDAVSVTVTAAGGPDYTMYYIIAAIVIIIVVAILIYWYMRRRRSQEESEQK